MFTIGLISWTLFISSVIIFGHSVNSLKLERPDPGPSPLIIGGEEVTDPHEFPFAARLIKKSSGSYICSGSISSPNKFLTAAHCFYDNVTGILIEDKYQIVAGCLDPLTSDIGKNSDCQIVDVSEVIIYPEFNYKTGVHDIALLTLSSDLKINNQTVALISITDPFPLDLKVNGTLVGWGCTSLDPCNSKNLNKLDVQSLTNEDCKNAGRRISDKQICAGGDDKEGGCSGDSGGPLICRTARGYQLCGILSYGNEACDGSLPDVYTRAAAYSIWISTGGDKIDPAIEDKNAGFLLAIAIIVLLLLLVVVVILLVKRQAITDCINEDACLWNCWVSDKRENIVVDNDSN